MDIRNLLNETPLASDRKHRCLCGKKFTRKADLTRHQRIHTGEKPYHCQWEGCNKQFIQRSALTVHIRTHTGERPHLCEYCQKPFGDSSSLARHRRLHTGVQLYPCNLCGKSFTRKSTLITHQDGHWGRSQQSLVVKKQQFVPISPTASVCSDMEQAAPITPTMEYAPIPYTNIKEELYDLRLLPPIFVTPILSASHQHIYPYHHA